MLSTNSTNPCTSQARAEVNEPIDHTVLASYEAVQVSGDPDLIVELINLYVDDVPLRVRAMRRSLKEKNLPGVTREAHSLRGSSGMVGANEVEKVCHEIEMLSEDALRNAPGLLNWLEVELERAIFVLYSVRTGRPE